jgi:hypothetical protein
MLLHYPGKTIKKITFRYVNVVFLFITYWKTKNRFGGLLRLGGVKRSYKAISTK